jgi:hypothetical protein
MKCSIAYVYPAVEPQTYRPLARRFVDSYMNYPPGATNHELIACINGGHPNQERNYNAALSPIPFRHFHHNNVGKDIGAFQAVAEVVDCDLLLCLGAPVRCRRAGWLDRIARAYEENGPGLYGCWAFHEPMDHIRTTAFWLPPQLLRAYPYQVVNEARYEFEHGHRSICQFARSVGLETYMVTWDGCYLPKDWHHIGADQSLFLDQHCDRNGIA